MASTSVLTSSKGTLIDPALCRCCRSIKKCRVLTEEYEWGDTKETYSDMIMDCFGLLLTHLDGESRDRCICATCVVRLRDACAFRRQVLTSEEAFMHARIASEESKPEIELLVKVELDDDVSVDEPPAHGDDVSDFGAVQMTKSEPTEMLLTENSKTKVKLKSKRITKRKKTPKKHLLEEIRYKEKMEEMLVEQCDDASETTSNRLLEKQKKKYELEKQLDHNRMLYENAVSIVHNSYVCPFRNRISNYYCFYCRDQFTNPIELREHTLTHNPKTFESMMENKKIPKIDVTRIDCRLCNDKINDLKLLKIHLTNSHGVQFHNVENEFLKFRLTLTNLTCTECDNSFPYFDMLKKHMIDHFGSFICDLCGACFLEESSLRTHIKSHSKIEKNFPCEVCGKNLKSKYSKMMHIATVHEKKATVNCYKCEAAFLSHALRNRHLIEVHGDKRTFPCKLCDKVYNRRKTLMEHNRRNHLKVYRHQCDLCEQRFYLPSRLKEHMATHTGERNYRCEFCDKSYPRLQSLQEHLRSHSTERRHKCVMCNSSFTQGGSLKSHMKTHHQAYDVAVEYTS